MNIEFNQLKQKILPYFIEMYGEEYKDLIIARMNQIEPVFYSTIDGKKTEMFTIQNEKRVELTLKFLEHNNIEIPEKIKNKIFYNNDISEIMEIPEANNLLRACFGSPIYKETPIGGIKDIAQEPTYRQYLINNSVEALQYLGIMVDPDNYNQWVLTDQAKEVFKQIEKLKGYINILDIEFNDFDKKFDNLKTLIAKSSEIERNIREKYMLKFLKSIEQYTSTHDKQILEQYLNADKKDWYTFKKEIDIFKITGDSFYENGLLDAFGSKARTKLNDPKTPKFIKQTIIDNRIKYYRLINLYHDQLPQEEFIMTSEAIENAPKEQYADEIISKKEHYAKLADNEILWLTSSYKDNIEQINSLNLIYKPIFKIKDIKDKTICISNAFKIINGKPELIAILWFSKENCLPTYIDTTFIHEINHAIELSLIDYNENSGEFQYKCGFEVLTNGENTVREYKNFSEVINQIIAMNLTEIMHKDGVYLFDNPHTAKIEGGTSYEQLRNFTEVFWQKFSKEIIAARINNNLESLYKVVGKANFDNLNNIINEYRNLPYYELMDDVINKRTTQLTEKREQLHNKAMDIWDLMITHAKQLPGYENLTGRTK